MINPVKQITDLCKYLPEKDKFYADAFILRRDFISLRDLINSSMKKVEKNYTKEKPNEDLLKIDFDKLRSLLNKVDDYLILLGEDMEMFSEDDDIYEEVETKNEECSQASGVASGVNGKIDSFPINPKEMEKQRLKEDINNPYFVIEDIGAAYLMAGPFKTKVEAERKKKEQIKEYNLEEEAEIIHVWDWNTIKEFEDNAYDTYQEFINAGDSAPYYKEEKLEESKEDDIFDAREELINYLNQNTKYEWDANESYDNCAITESDTDYIEVFVDIKDGNKIYTVDNYSYNSLEELVKNMPVLFTDEDEDYDYDEGWEKEEESTRLALSGKLLESSVYQEGQPFQPDKRDLLKMKEYKDKGSNPSAMAKSVKDINKALSRYFIACAMEWKSAKEAFYERILDLVGWSQSDKYRNIMEDLESQAANYEIPDEFKANTGTTEFPIDEKSENHLRDWYSKLYKVLKQNNLEYKLTQRAPTQQEMETDNINGRHWAIACTLTVKLPDGEVKDIYLCNDTNEGGGSFSVSSSTLGVWEGNQQQLANAFQELINKHSKKEEGKFKEQDMPALFTNEDCDYDSNWKNDLEETYNKLTELNDYNTDGKYVITYGRGDSIFFNSLEDAKAWQVKNIWNDDYANYQIEDPEDEDNPVRYDWEDIRGETDGNYLYEFVMYDKNGNKYNTDTTDGAGWFIQPNFINEL